MVAREPHFIAAQVGAERGGSRMCRVARNEVRHQNELMLSAFFSPPDTLTGVICIIQNRDGTGIMRYPTMQFDSDSVGHDSINRD